ncbi:MAG: hypothetical protein KGV59_05680 [Tenacibaculum sp.]|nr:hypothetical protein [Tenacibaculum sp.]
MKNNYKLLVLFFFSLFFTVFAGDIGAKTTNFLDKKNVVKLKDKINRPNTVGNFTYNITVKREVCIGDGGISITTTANAGTEIFIEVINSTKKNLNSENIVATGSEMLTSFENLKAGTYEVHFTVTKDGQTETINETVVVNSDRSDIVINGVSYVRLHNLECDGNVDYLGVTIKKGSVSEYKVHLLLPDNTLGKELIPWTKACKKGTCKRYYTIPLTKSFYEGMPKEDFKVRVISKNKCGGTYKSDVVVENIKTAKLFVDGKIERSCKEIEVIFDAYADGWPLKNKYFMYNLIDEDSFSFNFKGSRYKAEYSRTKGAFIVKFPRDKFNINDEFIKELGNAKSTVDFTICGKKHIITPSVTKNQLDDGIISNLRCGEHKWLFLENNNDHHYPYKVSDLKEITYLKYPEGFKPWRSTYLEEGSYTYKTKKNDDADEISRKMNTVNMIPGYYEVALIYECDTIKASFSKMKGGSDIIMRKTRKPSANIKPGYLCDKAWTQVTINTTEFNYKSINTKHVTLRVKKAPDNFLQDNNLSVPFDLKKVQNIDVLEWRECPFSEENFCFAIATEKYAGDYIFEIIVEKTEVSRGECSTIFYPADTEEIQVKIEKPLTPNFGVRIDLEKNCNLFEATFNFEKDVLSNSDIFYLLKYNEKYKRWEREKPYKGKRANEGSLKLSGKKDGKYRLVSYNKDCKKKEYVWKEFNYYSKPYLIDYSVFNCNNKRIAVIKTDGVGPFTY